MDDNGLDEVIFKTEKYLGDCFEGNYSNVFFYIFIQDKKWDYTLLSCFINNFTDLIPSKYRAFVNGIEGKPYHSAN